MGVSVSGGFFGGGGVFRVRSGCGCERRCKWGWGCVLGVDGGGGASVG